MLKKVSYFAILLGIASCLILASPSSHLAYAATDGKATTSAKNQLPPAKSDVEKKAPTVDVIPEAPKLDAENLKKNVYTMVLAALKQQGLPMTPQMNEFTADKIIIGKSIPFHAGGIPFFLVSLAIKAPAALGGNVTDPETDMEKTLVLTVDQTGTYHFPDVNEISTNKSMSLEAKRIIQKAFLPKDFGDILFTGSGTEDVVFISDVFCPFCRDAYDYFMSKKEQIKSFKILHMPIKELHPTADIASFLMEHAREIFSQQEYIDFINYAYTELTEEGSNAGAGSPKKDLLELELNMVKKLTTKYPALLKNHADINALFFYLKGKYTGKFEANKMLARSFGIQGTPAMFINGFLVKGFDINTLNNIFK